MNEQHKVERRAFNEALRARLRLVAADRGVSDDKMKWLGRLKHHDLVTFVQQHELDWNWVLSGRPDRAPVLRRPALRVIQGGLR
jgi:hypothetical protein